MATILPYSTNSIQTCVQKILAGGLVSFPTETVYGLGANALNEAAVEKIFVAKGRPKSDPLIVHVASKDQIEPLVNMSEFQRQCFDILADSFWPGPLTLIVKSSSLVPALVTAQSGFVGLRIPAHSVALELLKQVAVPIAAPSANRFGHVSPTTAQHVFDDLGHYKDLLILDGTESCSIGLESTVLKISDDFEQGIIQCRPGAISLQQIEAELLKNNINIKVTDLKKEIRLDQDKEGTEKVDSSGQFLTHYAPCLETFILFNSVTCQKPADAALALRSVSSWPRAAIASTLACAASPEQVFDTLLSLKDSVFIDFAGRNKNISPSCLCYFDLSSAGDIAEAGHQLFSLLRKAESVKNAKYILLPDIFSACGEKSAAVFDRIYRAASGKYVFVKAEIDG